MAKDKERSVNPAQQARKQEKNRALRKAKNEQQARRNEKFARRNPDRIQAQIDDLKALESSGEIKPREKAILADLERDLRAVRKAREALGEKAPTFGNVRPRNDQADANSGRNSNAVLGKRGRDGERRQNVPPEYEHEHSGSGNETDESVRAIPMPRDTPPPIPREFRRNNQHRYHKHNQDTTSMDGSSSRPSAPQVEHKTTYSSAPQLRDLRKEATSRFVPTAVKKKQDAIKGVGGSLLEPEELDRLEAAGYHKSQETRPNATKDGVSTTSSYVKDEAEARRLAEEEARFERELAAAGGSDMDVDLEHKSQSGMTPRHSKPRHVEVEEVEDEDM